ncbi:hypothetical protein APHAL10511_005315 [Amanita phalloides]|nr:hypothetical protein APHAL10511_005315 [Amanita phalloides]
MTVLHGSIKGTADGWKFYGKFSEPGGPPLFAVEGGLDKPIHNLSVPHAELVNGKVGSYAYEGQIGPEFLSIRSTSLPQVIVLGHLGSPIAPTHVAGWLQVVEVLRE